MKTLLNLAAILGVFCLCGALSHGQGRPTNSLPARVNLLRIPLKDSSRDPDAKHWQGTIDPFLRETLKEVKGLRILPESSFSFAVREMGLTNTQESFKPEEMRRLARIAGAEKVVSIDYSKRDGKWELTASLIDVASGGVFSNVVASSTNWMEIVPSVAEQIANQLGVKVTESERKNIFRPTTTSTKAFELVSRAMFVQEQNGSLSDLEDSIRQALKMDPGFWFAYSLLAQCLWMQDRVSEAVSAVEQLLKIRPDSAFGHQLLGAIFASTGKEAEGRAHLREAMRLDPDGIDSYEHLSELDIVKSDWAGAIANLKAAKAVAPHEPSVQANLAYAYARTGELELARAEAKAAAASDDIACAKMLGETYDFLNDAASAIHQYELLLARADAIGAKMPYIQTTWERVKVLKMTLTPQYVMASPPRLFTAEELIQSCWTNLSTNEFALVVNPLEGNEEMKRWAQKLVTGATNEFDKAHSLFVGITRHFDYPSTSVNRRTAIQSYKEWTNQNVRFTCQDYTMLLVVLARDVGLQAFYVWVEKDFRGRPVPHACAGIFVDGKALLVDPTYRWCGVPHQVYQFEDDRAVVGIYLSQLSSEFTSRVAVKLVPEFPLANFNLAIDLAEAGKSKAAEDALDEALKLDSTSWFAHYARGVVAGLDVRWSNAEMQFRDALDENPEYPKLHYFFGVSLVNVGKYGEAMKELQKYLEYDDVDKKAANHARELIKKITDSQTLPEGK